MAYVKHQKGGTRPLARTFPKMNLVEASLGVASLHGNSLMERYFLLHT